MEENNKINSVFYLIDGSTGEMKPLAQGQMVEMPKFANGGLEEEKYMDLAKLGEEAIHEFTITFKTITKKRFIKLLMGMGYQRNVANKMHQKYMEECKSRTKIGMILFETFYKLETELEIKVERRDGKHEAYC